MFVVCEEHLELALDRFIDEYEDAPDVVDLRTMTFAAWTPPASCNECERRPRYLVV